MVLVGRFGDGDPFGTEMGLVTGPHTSRLPALAASYTATPHTTAGDAAQSAVGAGHVRAALLLVVPLLPVEGVVVPAPCVPAQLTRLDTTATRA